jgi:hypothetical protein
MFYYEMHLVSASRPRLYRRGGKRAVWQLKFSLTSSYIVATM